jgi:hypothetical protein
MTEILSAIFTTLTDVFLTPPFRRSEEKHINVVIGILWFLFCFIVMCIIVAGVTIAFLAIEKTMKKEIDSLDESGNYCLAFIKYPLSTEAMRYVIYSDKRMICYIGKRKETVISSPICYEKIYFTETFILSDDDFDEIMRLANKINMGYERDVMIAQNGGFRFFVAYNGQYREFSVADYLVDGEYYIDGNEAVEEICSVLEKYYEYIYEPPS